MVLPNNSHSTGAAGTVVPTHLVNGLEYPVVMTADAAGNVESSLSGFGLVIPPSAVGAGKIYFDLHTTTTPLRLRKLFAIPATDVAVTGVVGIRLDAMRTSSVGTGGTAAVGVSASKTAASLYPMDGSTTLPAGITARVTPTAGATDEQWLWPSYLFTEETNMSTHLAQYMNLMPEMPHHQPVRLPAGKGLKVVQGSVAGVGTVGFLAYFTVE